MALLAPPTARHDIISQILNEYSKFRVEGDDVSIYSPSPRLGIETESPPPPPPPKDGRTTQDMKNGDPLITSVRFKDVANATAKPRLPLPQKDGRARKISETPTFTSIASKTIKRKRKPTSLILTSSNGSSVTASSSSTPSPKQSKRPFQSSSTAASTPLDRPLPDLPPPELPKKDSNIPDMGQKLSKLKHKVEEGRSTPLNLLKRKAVPKTSDEALKTKSPRLEEPEERKGSLPDALSIRRALDTVTPITAIGHGHSHSYSVDRFTPSTPDISALTYPRREDSQLTDLSNLERSDTPSLLLLKAPTPVPPESPSKWGVRTDMMSTEREHSPTKKIRAKHARGKSSTALDLFKTATSKLPTPPNSPYTVELPSTSSSAATSSTQSPTLPGIPVSYYLRRPPSSNAPHLTKLHLECLHKHNKWWPSNNRVAPVGCMLCFSSASFDQSGERGDGSTQRWTCWWCGLRVCGACRGRVERTKNRDVALTLQKWDEDPGNQRTQDSPRTRDFSQRSYTPPQPPQRENETRNFSATTNGTVTTAMTVIHTIPEVVTPAPPTSPYAVAVRPPLPAKDQMQNGSLQGSRSNTPIPFPGVPRSGNQSRSNTPPGFREGTRSTTPLGLQDTRSSNPAGGREKALPPLMSIQAQMQRQQQDQERRFQQQTQLNTQPQPLPRNDSDVTLTPQTFTTSLNPTSPTPSPPEPPPKPPTLPSTTYNPSLNFKPKRTYPNAVPPSPLLPQTSQTSQTSHKQAKTETEMEKETEKRGLAPAQSKRGKAQPFPAWNGPVPLRARAGAGTGERRGVGVGVGA
ncbi:hypothetical protein M501DRAFT_986076 [Patellaria atrata CBS 101060]|uniref:Uncharacterized protein n=1 Tax=Patellaria atrata CBS 101060 TaxID=1346257 RepID=A0A9P4S9W6_9PEZI|nr:hypothetical protein M501DRAFT_986076 [Patellaria atrata CBS 101060]